MDGVWLTSTAAGPTPNRPVAENLTSGLRLGTHDARLDATHIGQAARVHICKQHLKLSRRPGISPHANSSEQKEAPQLASSWRKEGDGERQPRLSRYATRRYRNCAPSCYVMWARDLAKEHTSKSHTRSSTALRPAGITQNSNLANAALTDGFHASTAARLRPLTGEQQGLQRQ